REPQRDATGARPHFDRASDQGDARVAPGGVDLEDRSKRGCLRAARKHREGAGAIMRDLEAGASTGQDQKAAPRAKPRFEPRPVRQGDAGAIAQYFRLRTRRALPLRNLGLVSAALHIPAGPEHEQDCRGGGQRPAQKAGPVLALKIAAIRHDPVGRHLSRKGPFLLGTGIGLGVAGLTVPGIEGLAIGIARRTAHYAGPMTGFSLTSRHAQESRALRTAASALAICFSTRFVLIPLIRAISS